MKPVIRRLFSMWTTTLVVLLHSNEASSQTNQRLIGTVSDTLTGKFLAGAAIAIKGLVNQSTTTDSTGSFVFLMLQQGNYEITVKKPGYETRTTPINFQGQTSLSIYLDRAPIQKTNNIGVQVPQLLNYQGFVKDASGKPVNGRVRMTFQIYDEPTGGNQKWSEIQENVLVRDGQFAVLLGTVAPISSTVFDGLNSFLSVQVGDNAEMVPRQKIVSVGYAVRAYNSENSKHALVSDQAGEADLAKRALSADNANNANNADNLVGINKQDIVIRMKDNNTPLAMLKIDYGVIVEENFDEAFGIDKTIPFKEVFSSVPALCLTLYFKDQKGSFIFRDNEYSALELTNSSFRLFFSSLTLILNARNWGRIAYPFTITITYSAIGM